MPNQMSAVQEGAHMVDINIGEMFLNFIIQKVQSKFCGLYVTHMN